MAAKESFYIPYRRFERVQFVEEGAEDEPPFEATIRTNLTFGELEALTWEEEATIREVWPLFAPYVTAWNLRGETVDGGIVEIEPPSVGGPEQFDYLPIPLFWQLVKEIKLRNVGKIDPKRRSRPAITVGTGGEES